MKKINMNLTMKKLKNELENQNKNLMFTTLRRN